jgi:hypothetical protein
MAIEDALQVVAADWTDIEPRLKVSELIALAQIGRQSSPGDEASRSLAVLEIIADALPPAHEAWSALRSSGTRFDPGFHRGSSLATAQLIDLAADALATTMAPADAAADYLEERSVAAIVASGGLHGDDDGGSLDDSSDLIGGQRLLSIRVDGRLFFPLFQFRSPGSYEQHELVRRLREQLGAASDPVGAAAWWLTPNPWLQARPADLLGTLREAQIEYAAEQLANDGW